MNDDRWEQVGAQVGRYVAALTKPLIWGVLVGGTAVPLFPEGGSTFAVVAVTAATLALVKPPRSTRLLDLPERSKLLRLAGVTVVAIGAAAAGVRPSAFVAGAVLHLASKALRARPWPVAVVPACVLALVAAGWIVGAPSLLLTSGAPVGVGAGIRDVVRFALLAFLVFAASHDQRVADAVAAARDTAVRDERARIARELHDVVAHHVSAMTIQAEAARSALPPGETRADGALAAAASAGRTALSELRTLLGVLRAPSGEDLDLGPQPTLDDLDAVLEPIRRTGVEVHVDREGHLGDGIAPAVTLSAFRIVQEALANVERHARATLVTVRVSTQGTSMVVEVEDDGRGAASLRSSVTPGYGIVGMEERAALVGGSVVSAPREDGPGWRVRAVLPLQTVPA